MSVSPRPLDDVGRRMLGILVDDGRMSVNELAARAGVSRATAYARYDRLVADGVIRGFCADVDPHAIGLDVAAMILINVEQGSWPTTRDKVSRLPGVEYVAMTSGEPPRLPLVDARRIPQLLEGRSATRAVGGAPCLPSRYPADLGGLAPWRSSGLMPVTRSRC